jgi:hypothetical protein
MASKPHLYGNRRVFSASSLLAALGDYLGKARVDHGMTFTDLGETLGKGDDAAARYVAGSCDMPLSTFIRGCIAFGKPFADSALSFAGLAVVQVGTVEPGDDATIPSPIARALSILIDCTRPDSCGGTKISEAELIANAGEIAAGFAIFRDLHDRSIAALTKGRG